MKLKTLFEINEDIYNIEIKDLFIYENYSTQSQISIVKNLFIHSYLIEKTLNKDLFMFTKDEITSLIKSARYSSAHTVRNAVSYIRRYMDWTYENKYRISNINVLNSVSESWIKELTRKIDKTLFKISDMEKIEYEMKDPQDKLLINLLWDGVYGKSLSELCNLKIQDVFFDERKLKLLNEDGTIRYLYVTDKTLALISESFEKKFYTTFDMEDVDKRPSDFIIKKVNLKRRVSDEDLVKPIKQLVVISYIKRIGAYVNEPKFNASAIHNSAMLYDYFIAVKEKNGEKFDLDYTADMVDLTTNEFADIFADKYQWSKLNVGSKYEMYNTVNYTRNLLNFETLSEVYR